MSTRASIYSSDEDGWVHLFEDVQEDVEKSGLHLDLEPVQVSPDTGQYGDFSLSVNGAGLTCVSVRLPWEICEAVAKFVEERRAWRASQAVPK